MFAFGSCFTAGATPEQRERFLPAMIAGDLIGSFAMTEPATGSDTTAITTTATKVEGGYRLNGSKAWVTLGPVCDLAIVFATTDPTRGRWGITAFLVDGHPNGMVRSEPIDKMGLTTSPFGRFDFIDCFVSEADRLGPEGAGGQLFSSAVEAERAYLYAAQLGATERLIERCIDRAQTRTQFGVPIGAHQAVGHAIADLVIDHEMARLLVYKSAALADTGRSVTLAAAMSKIQVSEMALRVSTKALQIFGAEGYTTEAGIEQYLRDAAGGIAFSGTADIQRNSIVRLLGIDRAPRGGS